MALYIIISIEEFGKVQNYERTILVKANKVREVFVNNYQIGYDFTKMESKETEWFIFEDTELNKNKVLFWAKECERNRFWAANSFFFFTSYIEYFDNKDKKIKTKKVHLDADSSTFKGSLFKTEAISFDENGAPIGQSDMQNSYVILPITAEQDFNDCSESDIDLSKPIV